jgi:hypothetical protein
MATTPIWQRSGPRPVSLTSVAYGRYLLPDHPPHRFLLDDPNISHTWRRIALPPTSSFPHKRDGHDATEITHSEDVSLTKEEIEEGKKRGGRWVMYTIWEMKHEPEGGWEGGGKGRGKDLVLVHGGCLRFWAF